MPQWAVEYCKLGIVFLRTALPEYTVKMHFSTLPLLATIASFASSAVAAPKAKPPAFFLAGDSTTAVQSAGGGGTFPQLPYPTQY